VQNLLPASVVSRRGYDQGGSYCARSPGAPSLARQASDPHDTRGCSPAPAILLVDRLGLALGRGREGRYAHRRVDLETSRGSAGEMTPGCRAASEALSTAAIDVYDTEPLPADHPLRSLPNAGTPVRLMAHGAA
jgi:hypothetical protein